MGYLFRKATKKQHIDTIEPPFSHYHRAELERRVQEGFEAIERVAAEALKDPNMSEEWYPMRHREFQLLMAADYYLRNTK